MTMNLSSGMSQQPTLSTTSPNGLFSAGGSQLYVPMRKEPSTTDNFDGQRIEMVRGRWGAQDAALLPFHRQVELNVRMIVGRHWDSWSPVLGQFVDITRFMNESERQWRQRPVINKMLHWYILTHARLTENPPVITFEPSTADRVDALLAEAMDTIFKTLWQDTEMIEVIDRLMAVLIPGGQAFLKSRVDYTSGEPTYVPTINGQDGTIEMVMDREGQILVDVLNPLECRGEWGGTPWHRKRWHIHRSFMTPLSVYEQWGAEVPPDTFQATNTDGTGGYLTRLLFGSGYFGAAQNRNDGATTQGMGNEASRREGYVTIDEMWEAPNDVIPGYAQTPQSAGGRLLIVCKSRVLWDSQRPYNFRYTSPLRCFQFVNAPGRPVGTSPQEMMNPLNQAFNRVTAQIMEHATLCANPIMLMDNTLSGQAITNKPGQRIGLNMRPGIPNPIQFVEPPPIGPDVWKTQEFLSEMIDFLGNTTGATGDAPTDDPSGIAIKQLRYNSDRFIGATAKRAVGEFVRLTQDWMVMLPTIWPEQKVLSYIGEDSVIQTITVYQELWEGNVRIKPDMDSMIPEGRGERIQRMMTLYQLGAFGPPGSPGASKALLDMTKFPNPNRASNVLGGVNRVTSQQAMGQLARGTPMRQIPVFEWYNLPVWLDSFSEFMSSPEYLKLNPQIQQQFVLMLEKLQAAQMAQQLNQMRRQAPMAITQGAVAQHVANTVGQHAPPPGPQGPPPHGGPPGGGGGHASVPPPRAAALAPQAPAPMNTPDVGALTH